VRGSRAALPHIKRAHAAAGDGDELRVKACMQQHVVAAAQLLQLLARVPCSLHVPSVKQPAVPQSGGGEFGRLHVTSAAACSMQLPHSEAAAPERAQVVACSQQLAAAAAAGAEVSRCNAALVQHAQRHAVLQQLRR